MPVQARYRTLALKTAGGSVAVFPAPHQYFFPRDFTSNLGFVWHRAWRGRVSLGIRQLRDENWQYYPWVNAPPGRPQRMSVFFLLSAGAPETALAHVLRYTNGDRFRRARRLQDAQHALASGRHRSGDGQRARLDAAVQAGAEGDGRRRVDDHGLSRRRAPDDLTDLRLDELHAYFAALRAQSDPDFLLIPAEEANVHLGGHWALVFPKPVYWFMNRPKNGAFVSTHPEIRHRLQRGRREGDARPRATRGRLHVSDASADEGIDRVSRSRSSTTDYFRDASYLGVGWKALPSDLSSPRLGDRAFDLLDELNNQGLRKRLLGEVDVFQFDHTHELYAHMNINYIKLDRLPAFDRWGDALAPLANGEFFTTTGEVLLPDVNFASSSADEIVAQGARAVDVPASVCRNRLGRRSDDASRGHRAGGHARVRQPDSSSGEPRRTAGNGRASRCGMSPEMARS